MGRYRKQFKKRLINIKTGFKPVSLKKWRVSSLILAFGTFTFFSLILGQYQINREISEERKVFSKYNKIIQKDKNFQLLKKDMEDKQKQMENQTLIENFIFASIIGFLTISVVIILDKETKKK